MTVSTGKDTQHLSKLYQELNAELDRAKAEKTYKYEVPLEGRQAGTVMVGGKNVVMLAANNYLGLANHPEIVAAAEKGLGVPSVSRNHPNPFDVPDMVRVRTAR